MALMTMYRAKAEPLWLRVDELTESQTLRSPTTEASTDPAAGHILRDINARQHLLERHLLIQSRLYPVSINFRHWMSRITSCLRVITGIMDRQ
ncbi:hypothetical protein J6590_068220 [Homalodisca vitripennis]|nr:hypothetical protein J6590_068220 [Homalodisca vitripennis]